MSVAVLGSISFDIVLNVAKLPKPGETVLAGDKAHYPGGKGANQAVASSRAGAPTQILGAVGDDQIGAIYFESLQAIRLTLKDVRALSGSATGQAHIVVSEAGENSIVIISGANLAFEYPTVERDDVRRSSVRLAQLEVPLDAIRSFFSNVCDSPNVTRILNAAPAVPDARGLFSLADVIVVNETELELFSEKEINEDTSQEALVSAARTLIALAEQRVVVTLGARGCLMVGTSDLFAADGYQARVVDTTGAGDCFCGVLAASLSNGETLERALLIANAAASLAVGKKGAGPSMPTLDEILQKVAVKNISTQ